MYQNVACMCLIHGSNGFLSIYSFLTCHPVCFDFEVTQDKNSIKICVK